MAKNSLAEPLGFGSVVIAWRIVIMVFHTHPGIWSVSSYVDHEKQPAFGLSGDRAGDYCNWWWNRALGGIIVITG